METRKMSQNQKDLCCLHKPTCDSKYKDDMGCTRYACRDCELPWWYIMYRCPTCQTLVGGE